ncbi:hypothetical protein GCM10011504_10640 [Siccirubricoccus deserti]|uniref:Uncharacterized protein n=1 Tax=Siccirubricoccus deserti TaxID=2013562 RepID=A0A9X0UCN5_9PROT|nr:hypothetical protein [Siccirubricoccus deserti]MBC4014681.1 hypothetical protein [Siccirubricoccus deserti]GGC34174.1 hypothetical protein GCM10011504_10640 [Siccirubricoccus deserti]
MAWTLDARIPLILVEDPAALAAALAAGPPAAVLGVLPSGQARAVVAEGFDPSTPHAPACACCQGRPSAAVALDRLFQARVRGQCPWFERVVALADTAASRAAVATALDQDAVTAARFRWAAGEAR